MTDKFDKMAEEVLEVIAGSIEIEKPITDLTRSTIIAEYLRKVDKEATERAAGIAEMTPIDNEDYETAELMAANDQAQLIAKAIREQDDL